MKSQLLRSSLKTFLTTAALLVAAVLLAGRLAGHAARAADETKPAADTSKSLNQAELDQKFQETLSGATLQGHFTNNRDEKGAAAKEDKYLIQSVTKMKDDMWRALIESNLHLNGINTYSRRLTSQPSNGLVHSDYTDAFGRRFEVC